MNKAVTRKKQPSISIKNPLEAGQNIAKGFVGSVATDVVKSGVGDFWKQVLGAGNSATNSETNVYHETTSGDLSEGEELILNNVKRREQKAKSYQIEAGEVAIEYKRRILHGESRPAYRITQGIETKTQEILIEIKRLIQTSKELQVQFKEVTVTQIPNPGKYHQTFFEWMLSVIKQARIKVEDSRAWLAVTKNKQQKRQYWTMFKKHGTSFGLSNERVVATQTG